ncbi:hypothetical protein RJ640_011237, partial [Escallonia rubra]
MKKFFAQPTEEKRKLRKDIGGVKPYDYGYEEFAKNVDDWKEVTVEWFLQRPHQHGPANSLPPCPTPQLAL